MIHIVNAENRHLYRRALMEMHQHRKQVFIDQMKWRLEAPGGLEIDAFDSEDTTYLLSSDDPAGPLSASARLLRTDRPHLMSAVFPHLCRDGVVQSPSVWEVSRFCPAPDAPKGAPRRRLLAQMIAAIMETALLYGVERVTFVASAALAPLALKAGWRASTLGPAFADGRDRITAIVAEIEPDGLREVRAAAGLTGPITRFTSGEVRRAA